MVVVVVVVLQLHYFDLYKTCRRNTIDRSSLYLVMNSTVTMLRWVCGGDVALCQITLDTCQNSLL